MTPYSLGATLKKKRVHLPAWAEVLFKPKRYKVLYGGRGSAKSYTVAYVLLIKARKQFVRCLCAREFQNSISESVHKLLVEVIDDNGWQKYFKITDHRITCLKTGSEFMFKGVRNNVQSIKSMQGITDLWLEEAQTISQKSWDVLVPTIRAEGSEIWVTFNPDDEDDPTYVKFVNKDGTPREMDNLICLNINWQQNPFFPEVLREEKDMLYKVNPDLADHVWGGLCRSNGEAQIFNGKWTFESFEIKDRWLGPYHGADWGFSQDPTVLVQLYIDEVENVLYIRRAVFGYGTELDHIPRVIFDEVPTSKTHEIIGDNARPETISHLCRKGYNVVACEKWPGSVEDGVDFLRNFSKIVIHTECEDMKTEARKYSYKVDRMTGKVLRDIVDDYNHGWDAVRYALEDYIKKAKLGMFAHLK